MTVPSSSTVYVLLQCCFIVLLLPVMYLIKFTAVVTLKTNAPSACGSLLRKAKSKHSIHMAEANSKMTSIFFFSSHRRNCSQLKKLLTIARKSVQSHQVDLYGGNACVSGHSGQSCSCSDQKLDPCFVVFTHPCANIWSLSSGMHIQYRLHFNWKVLCHCMV